VPAHRVHLILNSDVTHVWLLDALNHGLKGFQGGGPVGDWGVPNP
jgi:hypothetical protein